jgi:hypothetical protein
MKKRTAVFVLLLMVGLAIPLVLDDSKGIKTEALPRVEEDTSMEYILCKLSPNPVAEGFYPVVIMQYDGTNTGIDRVEKIIVAVAGSGTMVKLSDREYCVVTSEHIFSTHKGLNFTCPSYVVKVLREKGDIITRTLVDAKPFFTGKTGLVDVAVCMVSSHSTGRVPPFSPYQGGGGEPEQHKNPRLCEGKAEDLVIRSLVSGEEARLLLTEEIPNTGMRLYIVDYESIPGESGTGFVDRQGNLFVLKGGLDSDSVGNINKELRAKGRIDRDKRGYSTVVGSFSIKPK